MKTEQEIPSGYVRVTEVLSPYSIFSRVDPDSEFGRNISNAADRGSRVHAFCEAHALGLFIEDIDEDCKNYVTIFKQWFDKYVEKVILTEKRLNSPKYRISGAFDLLAVIKGDSEPSLIDYKTPEQTIVAWQLQTAAYTLLCKECLNISPLRRICLKLPREKERVKISEYLEHEKDENTYLKALELYRFFNH